MKPLLNDVVFLNSDNLNKKPLKKNFFNSFGDLRGSKNQINQLPLEILHLWWIYGWPKKGPGSNGRVKIKFSKYRNQCNQSIGHQIRIKRYKNTYGKNPPLFML